MSRYKSLADYPQEFFMAWELAKLGKLSIEFPVRGTATNKRQQLYAFRKKLRVENAALALPYEGIELEIEPIIEFHPNGVESTVRGYRLTVGQADWKRQLEAQAKGLGITPPQVVSSELRAPTTTATPTAPENSDAQAEILRRMGFSS